jgi:predicted RNA polymerase sigma factor
MPMITAAERTLHEAAKAGRIGRFQLEAAIQSAHIGRLTAGSPGWDEIALLYAGLVARAPTAGARVGHAAAVAECDGPDAGLALLEAAPDLADYQPVWALRAHLLARRGDKGAAASAYARAGAMTADPAVRDYLHALGRA